MKRIAQEIEIVRVDTLLPFPGNPNEGAMRELERSMEKLGYYGAIIAQKSTRRILAGNHRWELLRRDDEFAEVPVIWLDVDDAEAIAILLGDNRINRLGTDNNVLLAEAIRGVENPAILDAIGYDQATIDQIVASVAPKRGDLPNGENPESPRPRNPGNPVISYSIVFDSEEQQQKWYALLRWMKRTYEEDTVAARLSTLIDTILPEEGE